MLSKRILSSITTLALCASFMIPAQVFAAASFTGGTNVSGGLNVAVSITDLQVTGADPGDTVPVFLYVPAGSLSMTTTTGLTFTGSSSGQRLYFSGTLTDVNAALATLKYTHGSAGTFTLESSIIEAGQIYDPSTQHIYEVVNNGSAISATAARSAATSRSINWVSGYLANITSSDENSFVAARISQDGWFGASDSAVEGDWVWLDGPESGTLFWRGTAGGTSFGYENWANLEPNQSGDEDCSQFYANGSGWNDLPCSSTLNYYIVEYGAPGNLPNVASDTLDITLSADVTTQAPTLTSPTSTSTQNTLQLTYSLPEVPTAGSVTVLFNDGTTTTTLTMSDSQSVDTAVNLASLSSTTGVAATTAASLADGTYTVTLSYQDYLGNPASTDVETVVVIDTTGPVISGISVVIRHPPGANITWTTDEDATSHIEYGLTDAYGSDTTLDEDLNSSHTQTITSLSQVTTYHYRIISEDTLGNSTTTTNYVFTTSGATPGVRVKDEPITVAQEKESTPEKKEETGISAPVVEEKNQTPVVHEELPEILKEWVGTMTLNAADEKACIADPYLKNPIKFGKQNNPGDVKLLEQFLNKYENTNLPVDGVYSREDFNAVIKWQEKYAENILKPWGLKKGTGYVFKTSLAKIKEIEESACDKEEQK